MIGDITVTLPADVAKEMPAMAQRLLDHMHVLLERNTEGALNTMEKDELQALVDMVEFAQVMTTALHRVAP